VKITNLSLAAIAAVAMTTGAMADVDMKIGGQGVLYYQTTDTSNTTDLFNQDSSKANAGLQLNLDADLGNGFGFGYQESFLGSLGLENNLVHDTMQKAGALNSHAMTKLFVTKKVGNTTLKLGKQELPKSLSPLAFSEGWNVFKNTFDAAIAINTDIENTTIVAAYVAKSNGHGDLSNFNNLATSGGTNMNSGAYMLTVANKSNKMAQPTLTYYALKDVAGGESGSALWADVQVDAGLPVKFALQGGQIDPANNLDKTTVYGAKVTGNAGPVAIKLAYSSVDDGAVAVQNIGTGIKTPLYTQMVANQGAIASDADTVVLQASMAAGPGKLIAQYDMTTDNSAIKNDFNELDVIYKVKALGTDMLFAYVRTDTDNGNANQIVRFWSRYNF